MEIQELHRGRLIDHVQLVVKDLAASKRFYTAAFGALGIPLSGEGEDYFRAAAGTAARRVTGLIIPATTPPSRSIPTGTTWKLCFTARQGDPPSR